MVRPRSAGSDQHRRGPPRLDGRRSPRGSSHPSARVVSRVDDEAYSVATLIREIVEMATGEPARTQVWGPDAPRTTPVLYKDRRASTPIRPAQATLRDPPPTAFASGPCRPRECRGCPTVRRRVQRVLVFRTDVQPRSAASCSSVTPCPAVTAPATSLTHRLRTGARPRRRCRPGQTAGYLQPVRCHAAMHWTSLETRRPVSYNVLRCVDESF